MTKPRGLSLKLSSWGAAACASPERDGSDRQGWNLCAKTRAHLYSNVWYQWYCKYFLKFFAHYILRFAFPFFLQSQLQKIQIQTPDRTGRSGPACQIRFDQISTRCRTKCQSRCQKVCQIVFRSCVRVLRHKMSDVCQIRCQLKCCLYYSHRLWYMYVQPTEKIKMWRQITWEKLRQLSSELSYQK